MKFNSSISILREFTKCLKIHVTDSWLMDEIKKHPYKSSILAINDVLTSLDVKCQVYNLEFTNVRNLPLPFIAHIAKKSEEFIIVKDIIDDQLIVSNGKKDSYTISFYDFSKIFTGNVLIAEPDSNSGQINYRINYLREKADRAKYAFLGIIAIAFYFYILIFKFFLSFSYDVSLLFLVKSIGVGICLLLLVTLFDDNNPLINKVCSKNKRNGCKGVLSSKEAKITEDLSWSEVGFFYFLASWIILLIYGDSNTFIGVLSVLNLCALPFTFYSLIYQYIEKKWCLLCCIIQFLLWVEFFISLSNSYLYFGTNSKEMVVTIVIFFLVIFFWFLLKGFVFKLANYNTLQRQLEGFKYDSGIFKKILLSQNRIDVLDDQDSIVLGNSNADKVLTMVTNPYCEYCAKGHKIFFEWPSRREDIKLQIIFTSVNNDDSYREISKHFISINKQGDATILRKAMNDWFKNKDTNRLQKNGALIKKESLDKMLIKQQEWCLNAKIVATPTFLINGLVIPPLYKLEDVKYLI